MSWRLSTSGLLLALACMGSAHSAEAPAPSNTAPSMTTSAAITTATAGASAWPSDPHLSGNAFLPPGLLRLQGDSMNSPVSLWLDKGAAQWVDTSNGASCQSCHGPLTGMQKAAPSFPRLNPDGSQLINLDDQILTCRQRAGQSNAQLEDDEGLALSAVLHQAAQGQRFQLTNKPEQAAQWQAHLNHGTQLFARRMGRINLACVHCHEQNIGKQMRLDVISPGHPTGFPIYRMSWQRLGSIDRRLRACYSGVQAVMPPPGDSDLRDLELYLKVRAQGMAIDGPSIRR